MTTVIQKDIHKFKSQLKTLEVTIQSAGQGPKRYLAGSHILRKGKWENVGGEIMPKNPPAIKFESFPGELTGGKEKPVETKMPSPGDKEFVGPEQDKNAARAFIANAKTALNKAKDDLMASLDNLKAMTGEQFMKAWTDPKVVKIRSQLSAAMDSVGAAATQTYTDSLNSINTFVSNKMQEAADFDMSVFVDDLKDSMSKLYIESAKAFQDNIAAILGAAVGIKIGSSIFKNIKVKTAYGFVGILTFEALIDLFYEIVIGSASIAVAISSTDFAQDIYKKIKSSMSKIMPGNKELDAQLKKAMDVNFKDMAEV